MQTSISKLRTKITKISGGLDHFADKGWPILGLYLLFFTIFFLKILQGVGQFWDWTFPYFKDQIPNIFSRASMSWTSNQMGSPLSYNSDYMLNFVISLIRFFQPETLRYLMLVALFGISAFGVFLIARRYVSAFIAIILGLAAAVNPAIFYKLTAGHFDYFVSYTVFIYLIYFLLNRFSKSLKSAVVLGLFMAFIGAQIQFFVMAGFFVLLYFIFNRKNWRWRQLPLLIGIPIFINMIWLSNFIFGGGSVAATGANALKVSFKATNSAGILNILTFAFSQATLISRFYSPVDLILSSLIVAVVIGLLLLHKTRQPKEIFLLVYLVFIIFLGTGSFQSINLGPLTSLYPMFREVGHFGAVIILVFIVLGAYLANRRPKWSLLLGVAAILLVFISYNKFQLDAQTVNFASMRSSLGEFQKFGDSHPSVGNYRILTYPFFDPYAINQDATKMSLGLPLQNSGHDSFSAFATGDFIKNSVSPQNFQSSVQYKFLQTYDVQLLQPYNIRYIYDFSDIYTSVYDHYVPASTYNNDLSLIQTNKDFFADIVKKNPGQVKQVSAHILEITNYNPRISASTSVAETGSSSPNLSSLSFMSHILGIPGYTNEPSLSGETTKVDPLFDVGDGRTAINVPEKTLTQTVAVPPNGQKAQVYENPNYTDAYYSLSAGRLVVYTRPAGQLKINGTAAQAPISNQIIYRTTLAPNHQYYLNLSGSIFRLQNTTETELGFVEGGGSIALLSNETSNLVANPSFEQGLWAANVGDCNNYDKNPDIGMVLNTKTESNGKASLELSSRLHNACTSTNFDLEANQDYLLTYDYQSPNAAMENSNLSLNGSDATVVKGFQAIEDDQWHQATQLFSTTSGVDTGRLFLYAMEGNKKDTIINRYDNINLVKVATLQQIQVPKAAQPYTTYDLTPGTSTAFSFTDSTYSYKNILLNGSFEDSLWQATVSDCDNYDSDPRISMKPDTSTKTAGKQSLALTATRHNACTDTSTNILPDTDYVLSFVVKGTGAKKYGYTVNFNDAGQSAQADQPSISDENWHTFTKTIHTPNNAKTLTLYLYALESNGLVTNTVNYDNVSLIQLPKVDGRYFVVSPPKQTLEQPKSITTISKNITYKLIDIKGAKTGFFLNLSETFHKGWQLEISKTGQAHEQLPHTPINNQANKNHFKMSDYSNGWYVDVDQLCRQQHLCTQNPDGSYDIHLAAEFMPQRWFNVSLIVSGVALTSCLVYLGFSWRRRRKRKVAA